MEMDIGSTERTIKTNEAGNDTDCEMAMDVGTMERTEGDSQAVGGPTVEEPDAHLGRHDETFHVKPT